MGPFRHDTVKRATSALDQDFDLLGLSQNKAYDEDSFLLEQGISMSPFEDYRGEQRKQEQLKPPFQSTMDVGFTADPLLVDPVDTYFHDLGETAGFGLRNRSLTFHHYPDKVLPFDLLNSLIDPNALMMRPPVRDTNARLSFDFNEHNGL